KLVKAAETSFAKSALQQDQIRFLFRINTEAKIRRSTNSIVLGKAKVTSFKDLTEARPKQTEKEVGKLAKDKWTRGRKHEDGALEACMPVRKTKAARIREAPETARKPVQLAESQHMGGLIAQGSGRAPVAQM
ncbi:hypothetical protein LTR02_017616, partial [Friedmanniomyces endolithicus]